MNNFEHESFMFIFVANIETKAIMKKTLISERVKAEETNVLKEKNNS